MAWWSAGKLQNSDNERADKDKGCADQQDIHFMRECHMGLLFRHGCSSPLDYVESLMKGGGPSIGI